VTFPRIGGAAVAGRIVAVGAGIDRGRIGERVLVDPQMRDPKLPQRAQLVAYLGSERDGGFAEYVAVPSVNAHQVEPDLSDEELATFPCSYDTAEEMLVRAAVAEGETVVVTGAAGGVGTALIQLSLIRGAKVVAVAGAAKEARLRRLGAHEFVPREHSDLVSAVEELCGTRGVDVVADVVGGPHFGGLLKNSRPSTCAT
jgi:NADPH:quinone reductase-like Zn-dependent oxidoreductase